MIQTNFSQLAEAKRFIDYLFEDSSGSHFYLFIPPGATRPTYRKINHDDYSLYDLNKHCWITVNEAGPHFRNLIANTITRNVMVFDVDLFHDKEFNLQEHEDNLIKILKLFDKINLKPSMIIDSGRGYHFYLKLNSFNRLKEKEKEAMFMAVFNTLRPYLGADHIQNANRPLRLPGSYNESAERYCTIKEINNNVYDITDLYQIAKALDPQITLDSLPVYKGENKTKPKPKKTDANKLQEPKQINTNIRTFTEIPKQIRDLNESRLNCLIRAIELGFIRSGYREKAMHIIMQHLLVLMDANDASKTLFNIKQKHNIPDDAYNNALAECHKYNYKTDTIIKELGLTEEEARIIKMKKSEYKWGKSETKAFIYYTIIQLHNKGLSNVEISKQTGKLPKDVGFILKRFGLGKKIYRDVSMQEIFNDIKNQNEKRMAGINKQKETIKKRA